MGNNENEIFDPELEKVISFNCSKIRNNGGISQIDIFHSDENTYIIVAKLNGNNIHFYLGNLGNLNALDGSLINAILKKFQSGRYEYSDSFEAQNMKDFRKIWCLTHLVSLLDYKKN